MRGLAVLVMIAGHTLDSWTRLDVRDAWQFRWAMIAAGFGAPLFLFLAGITAALSAGSKFRRSGDARAASGAIVLRGFWICWLAFLFRVQAWALAPARTLSLSFGAAIAALAAFAALMLVCAAAKDRVMAWWSQRSRALPGWARIPGAGGRPERYER
jgi:uncharacterized membrane protein